MNNRARNVLAARWADVPLREKGLVVVAIPIVALVAATVAWFLVQQQADAAEARVAHTLEVLNTAQRANLSLLDAVISTRSYLLTGNADVLGPYTHAQAVLPADLDRLAVLVDDNHAQLQKVDQLKVLATQQMVYLEALRGSVSAPPGSLASETRTLLAQNDANLSDVRSVFSAIQMEEERLLTERTALASRTRQRGVITVGISLPFGLIGGGITALLMTSGVVNRVRRLEENAGRLARREALLSAPDEHDEIGRLGARLVEADQLLQTWEREVRAAEAFREHLIAASPGLIHRIAPATQELRYVSPNVQRLLGYTTDEVLDTPEFWSGLVHCDDRPALQSDVVALLTGSVTQVEREQRLLAKDGQYRWFQSVLLLERDVEGARATENSTDMLLSYSVDITALKEAEAALRRTNEELEERVRERTSELQAANEVLTARQGELERLTATLRQQAQRLTAQAQDLAGANRDLAQQNEENEMFVYSVSHDLRSPLVNLQGFSQELAFINQDLRALLAAETIPVATRQQALALLDGDMADSLRFIQAAVSRLGAIIDALLRLSRAGRLEYQWQLVDLTALVERTVDALHETISACGARVTLGPLPPVWGDPTALEQVFANLIGNALAYLDPARPGLIEVCGSGGSDEGATPLTFHVRDNGLGIPAHAQEKVFQIFQRLHPERGPGEGLGLALVRRIVERHHGTIAVESAEGVGSTFTVTLPRREGAIRDDS